MNPKYRELLKQSKTKQNEKPVFFKNINVTKDKGKTGDIF